MKSYVISWFDLKGRFRVKQYIYAKCVRNFVEGLMLTGSFIGRIRLDVYELEKHTGHFISKAGRV